MHGFFLESWTTTPLTVFKKLIKLWSTQTGLKKDDEKWIHLSNDTFSLLLTLFVFICPCLSSDQFCLESVCPMMCTARLEHQSTRTRFEISQKSSWKSLQTTMRLIWNVTRVVFEFKDSKCSKMRRTPKRDGTRRWFGLLLGFTENYIISRICFDVSYFMYEEGVAGGAITHTDLLNLCRTSLLKAVIWVSWWWKSAKTFEQ